MSLNQFNSSMVDKILTDPRLLNGSAIFNLLETRIRTHLNFKLTMSSILLFEKLRWVSFFRYCWRDTLLQVFE